MRLKIIMNDECFKRCFNELQGKKIGDVGIVVTKKFRSAQAKQCYKLGHELS